MDREYKVNSGFVVDIEPLSQSDFINYILSNSSGVGGDQFLYFEQDINSLYENGALDWAGISDLPRLMLVWSDFIESENSSIYKAWYIDTDKVINEQPLVLYGTKEFIYRLCGIPHSNYKLKLTMWRLNRKYNKKVKSVEIRCIDDPSIIKKVTNWDGLIPAVHKMKKSDKVM